MYLLDADTGALIAAIDSPMDKIERGIRYTDDFVSKLTEAKKNKRRIIAIHNHPEGYPPSIDDIRKAHENDYHVGIVVGANGQVYTYQSPGFLLSVEQCDDIQNRIALLYKNGYDVDRAYETIYNLEQVGYTIK